VNSYWTILNAVLPVFALMAVGGLARSTGVLTAETDRSLLRLTVNFLVPALILHSLLNNPVTSQWTNVFWAPLLGFFSFVVGYVISAGLGRRLGLNAVSTGSYAFAIGNYNYGYIAVPLVMVLFDRETLGVLFLHNLGCEIALWTVGLGFLRGHSWRTSSRNLWSAPVLAVLLGVGLNLSGASPHLPLFLLRTIEFLGLCAFPLALVLAGAIIFDYAKEFDLRSQLGATAGAVALRLAVLPFGMLVVAWLLPISAELERVLIVQAAMPAAIIPIVLTKLHGGDVKLVLRIVIATSAVSLLTIPLVIRTALGWFGL
jgi:malate permease and related proteins